MLTSSVPFIIAIASGKGGVGKSTFTTLLSYTLCQLGYRIGVLDADLYGPSLGKMITLSQPPIIQQEHIVPGHNQENIQIFSLSHIRTTSLQARAPIINALLMQCIEKIYWNPIDILLVDFPPGTGDIHLTLLQNLSFSSVILVTTPQNISLTEVEKTAHMFTSTSVPLSGIVENMSYFKDPISHTRHNLFGQGGGERLAKTLQIPFLGHIPLDPVICQATDSGSSIFIDALQPIAHKIYSQLTSTPHPSIQIAQPSPTHITITYNDTPKTWKASQIQQLCPCSRCRHHPKNIDPNVTASHVQLQGNYALSIQFSSGCSRGVYPLTLLRGAT